MLDLFKNKEHKHNTSHTSAQIGNELSKNVQAETNTAIKGMDLFKTKGAKLSKVGYEQGKGNLFEFIESAKLTKNMAGLGAKPFDKIPVTDVSSSLGGYGEHTAADDFRLKKDGKIIGRGQAKVNNDPHRAAINFTKDKYYGMQKNTTIDSVSEIKDNLNKMLENGEISQNVYNDAYNNLTGALTDPETGITSGGTTNKELKQFCGKDGKVSTEAVKKYARKFELKQYGKEMLNTSVNMSVTSGIVTGVISGVHNMFAVLNDEKELDIAIKDVGVDVVKSGARGGIIGVISSVVRIGGTKANLPILADGSCATVMAVGVIDGGVAIYEYAKGEIDSEQLVEQLKDTTIKSTATIYFTKAVTNIFGAANPLIPIAIYSVANYVVATTKEIIKNAELNAIEYKRLTELNDEMTKEVKKFHAQLINQLDLYEENQKKAMEGFLNKFDENILSSNNCDVAINAIVDFANQTGIALQHVDFDEFSNEMESNDSFVLK